jgi:hypothetical protein
MVKGSVKFLRLIYERIEKQEEHWLWRGILDKGHYPKFSYWDSEKHRQCCTTVMRYIWEFEKQTSLLPTDRIIRTCGNYLCVNPAHCAKIAKINYPAGD